MEWCREPGCGQGRGGQRGHEEGWEEGELEVSVSWYLYGIYMPVPMVQTYPGILVLFGARVELVELAGWVNLDVRIESFKLPNFVLFPDREKTFFT